MKIADSILVGVSLFLKKKNTPQKIASFFPDGNKNNISVRFNKNEGVLFHVSVFLVFKSFNINHLICI